MRSKNKLSVSGASRESFAADYNQEDALDLDKCQNSFEK